ncbi:Rgg/GadR/MutR family transcriptional regulator [Oenococcus sicerae]|uniref:Rgg/GadR/MutR family transcriptional regulator n=1 Tax=Oenococcus sicerae TaxID=2203724 RepID=A0AAE5TQ80_9LACO|nr:Rgg/GadR/MutR family transcriptional regulator [Oenococcus sicerae]QAS69534.1 Rgg/GadR/MutR family transcriptional regulator [Oenococcus sicerae]
MMNLRNAQSVGEVFQLLRKQRQVTVSNLAQDIISPSSVSKFEQGKSQLSFIVLSQLLTRLHISLDGFYHRISEDWTDGYESFLLKINTFYQNNDLLTLKKIAGEKLADFRSDQQFDDFIATATVCALIKSIEPHFKVDQQILSDLDCYFDTIQEWDFVEFSLFQNCMIILDSESIESILKEMLYLNLEVNSKNLDKMLAAFLNAVDVLYRRKAYQTAKTVLNQSKQIAPIRSDLATVFKQKFFENLLFLRPEQTKRENQQLVDSLRNVDANALASSYEAYMVKYAFRE